MSAMQHITDRPDGVADLGVALLPVRVIDDLVQLARLSADRLDAQEPKLADALRGVAAEARLSIVREPG